MKVGILSDTHGYLDDRILHFLEPCDEIWHGGDIGSAEVTDRLAALKPLRAVYGNIDGGILRKSFPENNFFEVSGVAVLITHIVGRALSYDLRVRELIQLHKPKVLVCGHSHILKVAFDKKNDLLYVNPGAAGTHGFHKMRTLIRMDIENGTVVNAEVVELGPRSNLALY
ncbi:MAG: metallophosphoesterase family protein [Flavobacteriales bacterium]